MLEVTGNQFISLTVCRDGFIIKLFLLLLHVNHFVECALIRVSLFHALFICQLENYAHSMLIS